MVKLGNLKRLDLRKVWKNEAKEFTPWLAHNIEKLGKTLGMDIEFTEIEATVGDFSLDLLAKDLGTNKNVIIENQLSSTDHNHLGKLLTYAAGYEASKVIWIADSIREEHRQVLEWLNHLTDSDTQFFGIVVELLQIDESRPALNFKPVVFPNEWQKSKRKHSKKAVSEKAELYLNFFQQLIDELREKHNFTKAKIAQPHNWYHFASGFSGVAYGVNFALGSRVRTHLYIDNGDVNENKRLFDWLAEDREVIEDEFDEQFEWERLDDKRGSVIAVYRPGSIMDDEHTRREIRTSTIKTLLALKKVFSPRLKHYKTLSA